MTERYLEDFAVGQVFNTGRLRVDKEQIFAFAKQFDPQPFHLDEAGGAQIAVSRTGGERLAHRGA